MKQSIRDAVASGLPVYAECGGLMYLSGGIADFQGNRYDMVDLPGRCEMQNKLQRLATPRTSAEVHPHRRRRPGYSRAPVPLVETGRTQVNPAQLTGSPIPKNNSRALC